jgi:simple sugar transport system ATP-binding protein
MRDGEVAATDKTSAFDRDKIIRAMVGRSLSKELYKRSGSVRRDGKKVLSVKNLSMGKMVSMPGRSPGSSG